MHSRYLGCFVDKIVNYRTRAIFDAAMDDQTGQTVQKCIDYCHSKRMRYAALQTYSSGYAVYACFCGLDGVSYDKYGKAPESDCFVACVGNPSGPKCGGHMRNSVYDLGPSAVGFRYLGCFVDSSDRAVSENRMESSNDQTVQKCINHCHSHKKRYAALQTHVCFCGSDGVSYDRYGKAPEGDCYVVCGGDHSGPKCGGYSRNSVYDLGKHSFIVAYNKNNIITYAMNMSITGVCRIPCYVVLNDE